MKPETEQGAPTTGVWTAETVYKVRRHVPISQEDAAIANAHNAELAAERKKVKVLVDSIEFIRDNAHEGVLKAMAADTLAKVKEEE